MTRVESVLVTAQTFGRDGAMFERLLGFVAQLSLVLWGLVFFTLVIRFVGIRIYRRGAAATAPVATVAQVLPFRAPPGLPPWAKSAWSIRPPASWPVPD